MTCSSTLPESPTNSCSEPLMIRNFPSRNRGESVKRVGDGRRWKMLTPGLQTQLGKILEETSAGDPMSALRWTNRSTEAMAEELTRQGYPVSDKTVARCLREMGYSIQLNQKTREGPQHRSSGRAVPLYQPA